MKKYLIHFYCTFLFLVAALCVYAQGQNNVWCLGNSGKMIDFNGPAPAVLPLPAYMEASEGFASVADAQGNLLFYSNGHNVWQANGTLMPNGTGLTGNSFYPSIAEGGSSTQGVGIVRFPGDTNRYYLFVLNSGFEWFFDPAYPGYLRYSVIDMSLNGGAGDVVAAQKNIVLDSFMSEKMQLVNAGDCAGYWLVAHSNNSTQYRSYKIDALGIHAPIISNGIFSASQTGAGTAGEMKISPDGRKIANVFDGSRFVEIGDFDALTGIISNVTGIDSV